MSPSTSMSDERQSSRAIDDRSSEPSANGSGLRSATKTARKVSGFWAQDEAVGDGVADRADADPQRAAVLEAPRRGIRTA